ncbi:MAG TPA: SHOCT domain-containing protein [Actinomycetes bacterium]|nr:SHOCT domain-containing protein [Actinomycetes bacterium]
MMWWNDGGWDAGTWFLMSLLMLLFWGGLIAVVVRLVGSLGIERNASHAAAPSSTGSADEVLAERFARGEIDEDEFKRRRDLLHSRGVRG